MRATLTRRRIGGAAAGLLIAATFLGTTAPAFAAVGRATVTNEALPAAYGAGQDVGFRVTFRNDDTSTYSKVYLTLATTNAGATTYLDATRSGATATKDCTKASPVVCTFKTVKPGEVLVVTAGYAVAGGTTSLTGQGIWSTSGQSASDGGTSHGDSWSVDPATAAKSDNVDVGGGFASVVGTTVGNGQTVTALNRQATKVAGLPAGVAATVADDTASGAHGCGPYDCTNAIGTWSDVTVGDGQTFGSPFSIVITYYQTQPPKSFVHEYLDANGDLAYELVGACPKKNPAGAAPCFAWNSRLNQATILTLHNGSWRGL